MRIAVFSSKRHDTEFLGQANVEGRHDLVFLEPGLNPTTASLRPGPVLTRYTRTR